MKNILFVLFAMSIIIGCSTTKKVTEKAPITSDDFEGWIKYKTTPAKPAMVPQEMWDKQLKELFGDRPYILHKNYYKPGQYCGEIDAGLEVGKEIYNPKDSLHYAWQLESDSAETQNHFAEDFITLSEMIELDTSAIISGISCSAIQVKMSFGEYIYWYNPDILKMKAEDYRGSLFDRKVIERVGCLPVKNEIPGMITIELIEYKQTSIADDVFKIPDFVYVNKMPGFF